jgi:hypothetical protein
MSDIVRLPHQFITKQNKGREHTPAPTPPASSEYNSCCPGLLAYPLDDIEYPYVLLIDMLENVRLAARGLDGPAANELSSMDAGPDDWGMRGVRARNWNVRVTDGNIVLVCVVIWCW